MAHHYNKALPCLICFFCTCFLKCSSGNDFTPQSSECSSYISNWFLHISFASLFYSNLTDWLLNTGNTPSILLLQYFMFLPSMISAYPASCDQMSRYRRGRPSTRLVVGSSLSLSGECLSLAVGINLPLFGGHAFLSSRQH